MDQRVPARWIAAFCLATAGTPSASAASWQAESDRVTPTATAASSAVLDMQQAVGLAADWYPSVRNAAGQVLRAEEGINESRAGYRPQVRAGFGSEFGRHNLSGYSSRQVHRFSVSASQMLYDFGKVSSAVDRAEAERAAARARVLLTVDDLSRTVAQAWIEVRRHDELLEIARSQLLGVTAIAGLVRERRAKGASPLSDEVQAQAREAAAQANELEVQAQLDRWRAQLRHLTGMAPMPPVGGEPPGALLHACQTGETAPVPALLVAQAEQRAAEADLAHARAQTRPTLALDATLSRGLDDDSRLAGRSYDATLGLSVNAPLYSGGGNQARHRAAGHALASAEAALDFARVENAQTLQNARILATGHVRRRDVLDGRTGNTGQTRDLYRQQYLDLGTRSLLDLLNAEQEFHQARQEQVINRYDLLRVQVECLYGTGRLRQVFELEGRQLAGVELLP